jgi:hypothetical protein
MKKIYNIVLLSIVSILMYSCDTTNEADYTPSTYIAPASFTLEENTASTTDNNFVITYSPTASGKAYFAVLPGNSAAPTSTSVHAGNGFQHAGNFDVDGTTPVDINVEGNIYGNYTYDVYAIHKSDDNLISETVTKLSVTTPDTEKPAFLGDDSSPYFEQGSVNPFAPVTFTFSEPVIYQGGDITFTAFSSNRTVIVNDASALSANGKSISVDTHGTFEQDDFIIVTWDEGTFKDNADKSVDALTGFTHYFKTRPFTAPEAAALMVGTYNYEAVMYGGSIDNFYTPNAALFLPTTGGFELKLDPSDASGTTLLGVNIFSPLNNFGFTAPVNLKIKFGQQGELAVLDELPTSGIPFSNIDSVTWRHYALDATTILPGFYDVTEGTINHYLSLVVTDTGAAIDDIDYNYTRVGTYAKSTSKLRKELKVRNEFLNKKREIHKTYSKKEYKVINIVK